MPPQPTSSTGLSDLLTTAKNLVQAINTAFTNYLNVNGQQSKSGLSSSATLIKQGPGRVCTLSITTAGSATGTIYDANSTSVTTNPIYVIPNAVGIVVLNMPVSNGIVVAPGTGQVVALSYS